MKTKLFIDGMTCSHCEARIENLFLNYECIQDVQAYASRNIVIINHDNHIDFELIQSDLKNIGYTLSDRDKHRYLKLTGNMILLLILTFVILRYGNAPSFNFLPNVRQNMGYGALFFVGLVTSVHCVAMCGGINLSQCNKYRNMTPIKPSLMYNLGRIVSYTILGGVIGGIGSVISFSGQARGYVTIAVSIVMIFMSIKMLKVFQVKLPPVKTPKSLSMVRSFLLSKGPFFVGIANGFMPCGPLQSMQLYALGTGSIIRGALSMFYFSVGTFALMFVLGIISSVLQNHHSKHLMKISGLLIFVLGISMFSRGAALAGVIIPFTYNGNVIESTLLDDNSQEIKIDLSKNSYEPLKVKKNIPVKLIITADADNINGCNNPITIPSLNIEHTLTPGKNEIFFTPENNGRITYTCWMGMISNYIEVVD